MNSLVNLSPLDRQHIELGDSREAAGDVRGALLEYFRVRNYRNSPAVLHRIGIAYLQLGEIRLSEENLQSALRLSPRDSNILSDLAYLLNLLGKHREALQSAMDAIFWGPENHGAWNNQGIALRALGDTVAAIESFRRAFQLAPGTALYAFNIGAALEDRGQIGDAIACYEQALTFGPTVAEFGMRYCLALIRVGRKVEACRRAHSLVEQFPGSAQCLKILGVCQLSLGQYQEASATFVSAIEIEPHDPELHSNLGVCQRELNRLEESLDAFNSAIKLSPRFPDALTGRGNTRYELGQYLLAVSDHEAALACRPSHLETLCNLGNALKELRRFDDALLAYREAEACHKGHPEPLYLTSLVLLRLVRLEEGFLLYESRWQARSFDSPRFESRIPQWNGRSDSEGELLIWSEQGIGDEIFFSLFFRYLLNYAGRVTLAADSRLHKLFHRNFPTFRLISRGDIPLALSSGQFSYQAPIGSLPLLTRHFEVETARTRQHLVVDEEPRGRLRLSILDDTAPIVVGIAWKSVNPRSGPQKSLSLVKVVSALALPRLQFVNLQYGDVSKDISLVRDELGVDIHQADGIDLFSDIDGLVSLISECDVVVSASNVTAHLAGALGKKGLILIPGAKGKIWYWHDAPLSPWYPSLELFHQRDGASWEEPLASVRSRLKELYSL